MIKIIFSVLNFLILITSSHLKAMDSDIRLLKDDDKLIQVREQYRGLLEEVEIELAYTKSFYQEELQQNNNNNVHDNQQQKTVIFKDEEGKLYVCVTILKCINKKIDFSNSYKSLRSKGACFRVKKEKIMEFLNKYFDKFSKINNVKEIILIGKEHLEKNTHQKNVKTVVNMIQKDVDILEIKKDDLEKIVPTPHTKKTLRKRKNSDHENLQVKKPNNKNTEKVFIHIDENKEVYFCPTMLKNCSGEKLDLGNLVKKLQQQGKKYIVKYDFKEKYREEMVKEVKSINNVSNIIFLKKSDINGKSNIEKKVLKLLNSNNVEIMKLNSEDLEICIKKG